MEIKEKVKNDILMRMKFHIDANTFSILGNVIVDVLSAVEVVELETLPATLDDTNAYIIQLFQTIKAPKLSQKTVNYYLDTIGRLICKVQKPLTKMTTMDIEYFLNSLEHGNNNTSLNNHRRNASAFFTWMRKQHLILENPCDSIEPYKEMEKPIDHLEPEEMEQLKTGCQHKRDRALIEVLRCTALRVGELRMVNMSDIDWAKGIITVCGEKNNTYRPVGLDSVAVKYLREYLDTRKEPLVGNVPLFASMRETDRRLSSDAIRESLRAIKERSGLERRVYPHLFRKTTATAIVKRGGSVYDAGEYLGHKDRSTAGRHYAYKSQDHIMDIFKRYVAA